MGKKVIIEMALVDECSEKTNQEIANEIFNDLSKNEIIIPWCKRINRVSIIQNYGAFDK